MTERLKSGVPQAVSGALLCAVEGCTWVAPPGECLCVNHVATRDARTEVMKQIAVAGGFAPPRPEFAVHLLNEEGKSAALAIAGRFSVLLDGVEAISGKDGRDMSIVRTKLEEACFFAKRAMASKPENQETTK